MLYAGNTKATTHLYAPTPKIYTRKPYRAGRYPTRPYGSGWSDLQIAYLILWEIRERRYLGQVCYPGGPASSLAWQAGAANQ